MAYSVVRRGAVAVASCVAGVALLAGCGGSGPGGGLAASPFDVARAAPDLTKAAGTSRYEVEMTYSTSGGPLGDMTMRSHGSGTYDFEGQIGDGTYTNDDPMTGAPTQEEVVFRNNVLYQRQVGASRWHEVDFSGVVDTPIGQHDPSQQLDLLRGVSDDVREVGSAEVRGDEVTRYDITIDPQRLVGDSGVLVDDPLIRAAMSAARPIPGSVFVDSDGRVRRLELRIETAGSDIAVPPELQEMLGEGSRLQEMLGDRRSTSDVSVEYFDFGVPVTAQVPDQSTVDTGPIFTAVPGIPELPDLSELPGGN
ncbi:hypothetical protein [Pseudonocardia zijingensis]|jgi:hypothetical protein|uniref:Lipoprotein LprG n=1 Tax=Pseudonocardia zijingensis TaxID=153376 RepID=A0ABN1QLC6_9PSEU